MVFPSYSTLTVLCIGALLLQLLTNAIWGAIVPPTLLWLWATSIIALVAYPFIGLFLEHAPPRAYLVILTGPVFILWRSWLAIVSRVGRHVTWVPIPRRPDG